MFLTWLQEKNNQTKDISCECKCKFDGRKCSSNQKWNNINVNVRVRNIYVKMFGILIFGHHI